MDNSGIQEFGKYIFGFFTIEIKDDIDFGDLGLAKDKKSFSTFIHEYIHFLQEISTTYGLSYAYKELSKLQAYLNVIGNQKENEIILPISLENIEKKELVDDLINSIEGDNEEWLYDNCNSISIEKINVDENELIGDLYQEGKEYKFVACPVVEIRFTELCGKEKTKKINFGALQIIEGMARMIEKHSYEIKDKYYQIQYDIVEVMCNYLYKDFAVNKANIVALCDASLMYDNPGMIFYASLKIMKNKNFIPSTPEDIYKFIFKTILPSGNEQIKANRNNINNVLDDLLMDKFTNFSELKSFLKKSINYINTLRDNNCNFISKVMSMDSNYAKNYLINLMNDTGLVLIIDKRYNTISTMEEKDEQENSLMLYALYALYNLLDNQGKDYCIMREICSEQKSEFLDNNCISKPWEKVKNEKLCPLAKLWYQFKLEDKYIKR